MNDIANEERLVQTAQALRRKRLHRIVTALGVCVLVPTLLAILHYGFLARGQYESVTVFTVESGDGGVEAGKKGNAEQRDLDVARAMITSRAMLDELIEKHGWLEHYQSGDVDWWSRLPSDAGTEEKIEHYLDHVEVVPDSKFAFSVHVFAFSPEAAQKLNTAIIDITKRRMREQWEKSRDESLAGAREEIAAARKQLLDLGSSGATDLELDVARSRLASAMRGLEMAEVAATKRMRRLVVVSEPSHPDEASRPRRLWNIATVLVTALALGGMVLLLGGFVREHAKF